MGKKSLFGAAVAALVLTTGCGDVGPTSPSEAALRGAVDEHEHPPAEGPTITSFGAAPNPAPVGTPVELTATATAASAIAGIEYGFADDGLVAEWLPMAFVPDGEAGTSGTGSSTLEGLLPGVYELCARGSMGGGGGPVVIVTDGLVAAFDEHEGPPPGEVTYGDQVCEFVVVFDPDGGFVTGGGWIHSQPGAFVADPILEGKATFGFVAKYKQGADVPTGNTEFQFHAGSMNFHSYAYEFLVVAGDQAQYKGWGSINGEGEYRFKLWAGDGAPDTLRIKIWQEVGGQEVVVYDNGPGVGLSKGSIMIHKK